jgi:2-C-methyl-D-erythritol 4-phosphate cytidylyltransferase
MGFDKLWAPLGDGPVISHALGTLAACPEIEQVTLVVARERLESARQLVGRLDRSIRVCVGGKRRRDSVAAGLEQLSGCSWVLVHDAARPFLTPTLIREGLEAARATGVAVAAVAARDTIKRVSDGAVVETLPRQELWLIQTPQIFRADLLRTALGAAAVDVTDEAALIERMGGQVRIFSGADSNWKITTPADLELARAWLAHQRVAVGHG